MPRTAAALRRSWPGLLAQPDPQLSEPSNAISEGTSSARMIEASISTASAAPTPTP